MDKLLEKFLILNLLFGQILTDLLDVPYRRSETSNSGAAKASEDTSTRSKKDSKQAKEKAEAEKLKKPDKTNKAPEAPKNTKSKSDKPSEKQSATSKTKSETIDKAAKDGSKTVIDKREKIEKVKPAADGGEGKTGPGKKGPEKSNSSPPIEAKNLDSKAKVPPEVKTSDSKMGSEMKSKKAKSQTDSARTQTLDVPAPAQSTANEKQKGQTREHASSTVKASEKGSEEEKATDLVIEAKDATISAQPLSSTLKPPASPEESEKKDEKVKNMQKTASERSGKSIRSKDTASMESEAGLSGKAAESSVHTRKAPVESSSATHASQQKSPSKVGNEAESVLSDAKIRKRGQADKKLAPDEGKTLNPKFEKDEATSDKQPGEKIKTKQPGDKKMTRLVGSENSESKTAEKSASKLKIKSKKGTEPSAVDPSSGSREVNGHPTASGSSPNSMADPPKEIGKISKSATVQDSLSQANNHAPGLIERVDNLEGKKIEVGATSSVQQPSNVDSRDLQSSSAFTNNPAAGSGSAPEDGTSKPATKSESDKQRKGSAAKNKKSPGKSKAKPRPSARAGLDTDFNFMLPVTADASDRSRKK